MTRSAPSASRGSTLSNSSIGVLLSASVKPMMSPVARATPSRMPRPLPRRSGDPMTTMPGRAAASALTSSRVLSVPSAETMISDVNPLRSKYSSASVTVPTMRSASLYAGMTRLMAGMIARAGAGPISKRSYSSRWSRACPIPGPLRHSHTPDAHRITAIGRPGRISRPYFVMSLRGTARAATQRFNVCTGMGRGKYDRHAMSKYLSNSTKISSRLLTCSFRMIGV